MAEGIAARQRMPMAPCITAWKLHSSMASRSSRRRALRPVSSTRRVRGNTGCFTSPSSSGQIQPSSKGWGSLPISPRGSTALGSTGPRGHTGRGVSSVFASPPRTSTRQRDGIWIGSASPPKEMARVTPASPTSSATVAMPRSPGWQRAARQGSAPTLRPSRRRATHQGKLSVRTRASGPVGAHISQLSPRR